MHWGDRTVSVCVKYPHSPVVEAHRSEVQVRRLAYDLDGLIWGVGVTPDHMVLDVAFATELIAQQFIERCNAYGLEAVIDFRR